MEKLYSGQSFLYRDGGYSSTVFEIKTKANVRGDHLQRALTTAIKRYPYLSSKLIEKDGDFYIEDDLISMNVKKLKNYIS